MAENKTKPTRVSPDAFIRSVASEQQRKDCVELIALMRKVTGEAPNMWGSKRQLILPHWRQPADLFAKLAVSPAAALRNLAYMHHDCADPALRRHGLRYARAARARYEQLLADAISRGEPRAGTDLRALARMIEVTLGGSFLAWTLHREGSAATRFREDLDNTLQPYLAHRTKRVR